MSYTNSEMAMMLDQLEPLLERTDIIGYAAARNTRILRSEAAEYLERQSELISRLGEDELDAEGNPTGRIGIQVGTEAFEQYVNELSEWASYKGDPQLYTIPMNEAIGKISGSQLLDLEWMFSEEE